VFLLNPDICLVTRPRSRCCIATLGADIGVSGTSPLGFPIPRILRDDHEATLAPISNILAAYQYRHFILGLIVLVLASRRLRGADLGLRSGRLCPRTTTVAPSLALSPDDCRPPGVARKLIGAFRTHTDLANEWANADADGRDAKISRIWRGRLSAPAHGRKSTQEFVPR